MRKFSSLCLLVFGMLLSANVNAQGRHFDGKPYVEGEFLVQYKAGTDIRDLISRAPAQWELELVDFISPPMRVWQVKFNHNAVEHWQFQNWCYEQEDLISLADYNYYIEMRSTLPNDVNFTQQWHHNNTGQTGGTVDADIDSDLAWDITTGGLTATNDDIVVCIIESTNLDHSDLDPNRWFNAGEIENNGIDDDGNGYVDDYHGWNPVQGNDNYGTGGHGTNCAGMFGAKGNNGSLVAGANWDVKIMVVGDYSISTQANAIAAYTYPLTMRQIWNNSGGTQGAFVVATSSSWGIDGADPANYPLWCSFYDTLGTYGVLNVGATTNQNLNVDTAGDMPTACASPYMIGVGRTDHNDNHAGGYGQTTIELGAPGINVVTTANTNTITTTTGTSFSCPLTAGVIGLAYSIPCPNFMSIVMSDPQQGADLVLQALLNGTDPKPQLSSLFVTGGRLNSRNTLDELMNVTCSGTICLSPSALSTSNINDNDVTLNFNPYASGDQTVLYYQVAGSGSWTAVGNVTSPYNLSGLTGCENYEWYLVTVCGTDTSSATQTQTFTTTGCGNCIDLPYCPSTATDANDDEWIDIFTIDTYTNNSGTDGGYGDYTGASVITLTKTMTYNVSVTPDWSGTLYDEYSRIWIDLDQSGTFDAGELLYDQGAATQTPATGTITIPAGATVGSTRMRVQMAYQGGGQATLPDVCGDFTWGEVEDYCVDIIDNNPCAYTVVETITNVSCNGGNDGSINLNVSGAVSPYTYNWSPAPGSGQGTATASGLSAGTYSVTIDDNSACGDTVITFTVTEPTAISLSNTSTNVSCNGANDGAIDLTVTGGTPGYTYAWTPGGETSEDISGLSGGNYSVTVTDANGCTANSGTITITEPTALSAVLTTLDGDCTNPGSAAVNAVGGTPGYTYNWSPTPTSGQGTASVTYATGGSISVTVTDANGCQTMESGTITIVGAATIALNSSTDPSCNGGADGSINIDITGGTAPFTFSWTPSGSSDEDPSGLGAGTHDLTMTDAAGCVVNFSHTLNEPTAMSGSATTTDEINGNDGTVDLTVSGGTPPYTYSWAPNGETTEDLSGQTAGTYTCTITDANGCTIDVNATVNSQVGLFNEVLGSLNIFPNPSHGSISISFNQSIEVDITIYNSVGQVLMTTTNNGQSLMTLDLNSYATGVYIVNIKAEDGTQVNERITIKR